MRKNFLIDQSIALKGQDFYYDLHNCYDFSKLEFDKGENYNNISLHFKKNKGAWVKPEDPQKIVMLFLDILYFDFSDLFFTDPSIDIEEIGYKDQDDFSNDFLLNEEQAPENSHVFVRFSDDHFLRIGSETIIVKEGF